MSKALDLANGDLYLGLFAGTASPTFTGVVTVADGSNDINIASHDGTNGLKLAGSLVTSNATELNLLDNVSGLVKADLTKLAGIDASAVELNLLDGVAGLVQADLTKLAAIDATASDLNAAVTLTEAQAEANSSSIAMSIALG